MPPRAKTKATKRPAHAVPPDDLRWRCDPQSLSFTSTEEVQPVTGVVGQETAAEALRFGLQTTAPGQHIFVRGPIGSGRLTLVRRLVETLRLSCPEVRDRCYVHNFNQPDRPRLIVLPRGQGTVFRRQVDRLADFIREDLPTALESEGVRYLKRSVEQVSNKRLKELVDPFEKELEEAGLKLVSVEAGPVVQASIFPVVEGRPVSPEEFDELHARGEISDDDHRRLHEALERFHPRLVEISEKVNVIRREYEEAIDGIVEEAARAVLAKLVEEIEQAFPQPAVKTFLDELIEDVVKYRLGPREDDRDFTRLYRVNVVLEHGPGDGCPVIVENSPTVRNLRGTIDYDFKMGEEPFPSHMGIRAGSLLRADGGFLILEDRDLLSEPGAWRVLVRTLRTGRLEIAPPDSPFAAFGPTLKPEPIDINLKVILLGDDETYAILDAFDHDFPQLFKVLADFNTTIPRDEASVEQYAAVVAHIVREEKLPHFDRSAVAELVEHGARIAARQGKLTARFGRLADIVREAAFVAGESGNKQVTGADVREAVRRGKQRADLPARQFRELVREGMIQLDVTGSAVGQINGLAVLRAGPMVYGFPSRITATIGPGTAGVINIEREAALSGAIHTKGFYILGGLLRYLLRTDHPLAFDASVAFEQSYGGIDGDSASGAEICCLLSALTDIPLRQDVAMTGAIDQVGHIMPVGAVNEKIEGFYDTCRDLGMTGTQGVIIPRANAGDLMLRHDMLEDCRAGRFTVYAVESVHEALEILTGRPAGRRRADGSYPVHSVLGVALRRARLY
ncbi:MAG: ATP-binding protein, partial [Planctomycetota bacterium]